MALRDAFRRAIADDLRCPKCKALNRPGVYLITLDSTDTRAFCNMRAHVVTTELR